MLRTIAVFTFVTLASGSLAPTFADDVDSLRGQFTFDWHKAPEKQTCAAVDDKLLAAFKSKAFTCDLNAVTNTASDNPARVCSQGDEGAEYLIFETKKACEEEREAQAANSEE